MIASYLGNSYVKINSALINSIDLPLILENTMNLFAIYENHQFIIR